MKAIPLAIPEGASKWLVRKKFAIAPAGSTPSSERLAQPLLKNGYGQYLKICKRRSSDESDTLGPIPEVFLFTPTVFGDERGFSTSFQRARVREITGQQTECKTTTPARQGAYCALHYQLPPHARETKLVRVVQGEVFDVAVDIRRSSPTLW